MTTTGENRSAFEVAQGRVTRRVLTPGDFGVPVAQLSDLSGGLAEENCEIARRVLGGERGATRDIVLVNAALALVAAEKAENLEDGVRMAGEAIDSGRAKEKVARLAGFARA